MLGDTPRCLNIILLTLRHWVHDPLALAELGVPWWTYRAIDIVDAWLTAHVSPVRVFEYGSGASTIWLAG